MKKLRFMGERLKELRERAGLSQDALAKRLEANYADHIVGVTQGHIGHMEKGNKRPSFELLDVLVDFFNVGYDFFLEGLDANSDDPCRVVVYTRNEQEARTIRRLGVHMDQLSIEERNQIYAIVAECMALPAAECVTIHSLINNAMHLSQKERGLVVMLTKRLSETRPLNTKTVEADQAADLIDGLPEHERAKALNAVRDVANMTRESADLRANVSSLLSIVEDVSDPIVRDRIRIQIERGFGIDISSIK